MRAKELRPTAFYTGFMVAALGVVMLVPMVLSLCLGEWASVFDYLAGAGLAIGLGAGLMQLSPRRSPQVTWGQGMAAAAASWLLGMLVAAVPLFLSGHYETFLDATFDAMSALTTTGLTLIVDPEHAPYGLHLWRALLAWAGGVGMVVAAISFFARGLPGALKLYAGEGRDERLLPNVGHTARAIRLIGIWYLIPGVAMLTAAAWLAGLAPLRALWHGTVLFLSAFSTAGFVPASQRLLYYHSGFIEIGVLLLVLVGSLNFHLHWAVWTGNRGEIWKNLETRTFVVNVSLLTLLATWELARHHRYEGIIALFRKGVFQVIAGHTTAGFMTVPPAELARWGPMALVALTLAMIFGGSLSSTAGGIKSFRIGLVFKAWFQDVRRLLAPETAVVVERYHMGREAVLEDRTARTALTMLVVYLVLWSVNTVVAAAYSYPLQMAVVEGASVVGNAGLTTGLVAPGMPHLLEVLYIISMWMGRLEFLSIFVLGGLLWRGVRGR